MVMEFEMIVEFKINLHFGPLQGALKASGNHIC